MFSTLSTDQDEKKTHRIASVLYADASSNLPGDFEDTRDRDIDQVSRLVPPGLNGQHASWQHTQHGSHNREPEVGIVKAGTAVVVGRHGRDRDWKC